MIFNPGSPSSYHQYHKNTGREKLQGDIRAGHLFFDHGDNLRQVDLRYVPGRELKDFFDLWLRKFPDPYLQRYRKSIPFAWVKKNGLLLMSLRNGEVEYPNLSPASPRRFTESEK